jgi:predicted metal-dependent peptidase
MRPNQVYYKRSIVNVAIEIDVPDGTFDEVIAYFQALKTQYGQLENVRLSYGLSDESYDEVYNYYVNYSRIETDDEMNDRIEQEEKTMEAWMKKQAKEEAKQAMLKRRSDLQSELERLQNDLRGL